MTKLSAETLRKLVQSIISTQPEEVGCDACIDRLEYFVEQELRGENVAEMLPLIKHHLDSCFGCGEEYEALIDSLDSVNSAV